MKEIVVISGKGGTGKTSVTASFAVLAGKAVVADCDVDAADLYLLLMPTVKERHQFYGGNLAVVRKDDCIGCGACLAHCRFNAVIMNGRGAGEAVFTIDPLSCEGCGVCVRFCPVKAIDFPERLCGEWMVSDTRCGSMVHARLGIAAGNSGKLVSIVRREARRIAEAEGKSLIIVDGPPGIGCPVIASVTGATHVLVVTEPTVSGAHDLERVLSLTNHFKIPAWACVNKWDINSEMTEKIEEKAGQLNARIVGRIRYDRMVTMAQINERSMVETESACGEDIKRVWEKIVLQEG
ncbi:MAG: (4Fe-4S)-binding protein [Candidatus Raymondbacteria bacterium RifOxyA12_full_50_37]|uniref:(4Fe-4S)-binding protein n=1 Tax=Candidatus Raymondbacteria bacterium RIFOXYD12_FULL_49_13 TaxID=1817890 RepID=A0A1F7F2R3_UNCRA|nr:MAG: (4Fe-4S)-binding protein [Candidatus Raymondbacteria bacterium RifOxyA12_full_50_37]OGJ87827.1 MAG: (4Fe-4S)-binding protein [Candidatus Raymondbacteria bacterium RifOxyB12_full_50_8]OGJ88681.1 MAG: (4Fe-4S)-binding protein [Candidatus Raymondbacteria bacterium RIFOXYA2_FULL_49_16]OGJ95963.1 MAG: (4Fe-4S)-binding protein [Candidatus Raymondbacteria bacterium RifOxyC12_full_50_8]OGK00853.1 MAG: (4Fe-4S)-binding protein [Candidatus Raymondbacteria bacterium RIFOXYD12_FULL_49_13]OGP41718.